MAAGRFEKSTIFRFITAVVLALAAIGLFLISRPAAVKNTEGPPAEALAATSAAIDRDTDSLLAHFEIDRAWVKKRSVAVGGSPLARIERRVLVPAEIPPVQINHACNAMAKKYGGRAVASENTKENLIAIHIEINGFVVETIILKPTRELHLQKSDETDASSTI